MIVVGSEYSNDYGPRNRSRNRLLSLPLNNTAVLKGTFSRARSERSAFPQNGRSQHGYSDVVI